MKFTREEIAKALKLYVITDRSWLKEDETLLSVCEKVIQNGATFLQLREKELNAEETRKEAIELQKLCRSYKIPFVVNEITEATSPVKLFEYMALGKPIVTTALPECRKYESPLVSDSHEDFINNIKKAAELENSKEYIELLRKEGNQNTWRQKAKDIKELILNS